LAAEAEVVLTAVIQGPEGASKPDHRPRGADTHVL